MGKSVARYTERDLPIQRTCFKIMVLHNTESRESRGIIIKKLLSSIVS